jgi:hypothetical protein
VGFGWGVLTRCVGERRLMLGGWSRTCSRVVVFELGSGVGRGCAEEHVVEDVAGEDVAGGRVADERVAGDCVAGPDNGVAVHQRPYIGVGDLCIARSRFGP